MADQMEPREPRGFSHETKLHLSAIVGRKQKPDSVSVLGQAETLSLTCYSDSPSVASIRFSGGFVDRTFDRVVVFGG